MTMLLAIGAHPDDETMFAGGTLAWAAARGLTVRVLGVTRGEGGETGEPPVTTQDRLGETREAELRAAVAALGLEGVDFLPFTDPLVAHTGDDPAPPTALFRIDATLEEFVGALVAVIRRLRPDLLLTHGSNGEYGHPQHVYTHEAVREAFTAAGDPARFPESGAAHNPAALYTWAARYQTDGDERLERLLNADDPATWTLALDEALLDRKERAASCHLTQVPLFLRRAEGKPLHAMLLRRESLRRVAVLHGATDPLERLLATEPLARREG
jgi:LmbE family N-acetylglucosaminyl deacetylase